MYGLLPLFFHNWFKFQDYFCNESRNMMMLCHNINDIAVIIVKDVDYCCIFYDISNSEANLCFMMVGICKNVYQSFSLTYKFEKRKALKKYR